MTDLFPEIEIRADEADAIARGLYALAKADGDVHGRELAMIGEFYAGTTERPFDFAALDRAAPLEPQALAAHLASKDLRRLFLKTAFLLSLADGEIGAGERQLLGVYARELEVSDEELATLEEQVKEFLLAQLSHLQNIDAAVEVSKELKVGR